MAEEAERLSSGANLLGLILKVETERAEKYHNILLQLAGEDNAIGVSRILPGGASTFGTPSEQAISRARAEQGGVDRDNQPEAESGVTVVTQSEARLGNSDRLSISTGGSPSASQPPTTRGRKSASHGGSAKKKRMLLRSSFSVLVPTATVNGPQRTRGQSSRQRTGPTSSPFVLTGTNDSELRNFISPVEIFTRVGLTPLGLTRAEVIRSEETPGVTWGDISGIFGGPLRAEWVERQKLPGYKMFLCADHTAQPYLPTGTGEPGLILRPPTITCAPEDDNVAFHVLSCSPHWQDNLLYYRGEYTKIPLSQVEVSFCDLPTSCRNIWLMRLFSAGGRKRTHAALRARIKLRNQHDQEPSVAKVQEYLRHHPTAPATYGEISAAFRAGEEKMLCYGIRCTTYDSNLATIIQRNSTSNN